jgi:hypothetical protein
VGEGYEVVHVAHLRVERNAIRTIFSRGTTTLHLAQQADGFVVGDDVFPERASPNEELVVTAGIRVRPSDEPAPHPGIRGRVCGDARSHAV